MLVFKNTIVFLLYFLMKAWNCIFKNTPVFFQPCFGYICFYDFPAHLNLLKGTFWDCQTFSGTCKRFMTVPGLQVCQCLFQNLITNLTEDRTVKVYNLKLIHESYGDTKSAEDEYTTDIGCQD